MAVNTQFSIAAHIMVALASQKGKPTSSAHLAGSVNTSPSFVRRTLAKLSKAGLVETSTGKAGDCRLARAAAKISLWEVYTAVNAPQAFAIHGYPVRRDCPVSCGIKPALGKALEKTQRALEVSLSKIPLSEVLEEIAL